MSASNSYSSTPTSTTNQQFTSTSSGASSPVISSSGAVTYNDAGLQLATISGLEDVVRQALAGAGSISNQALNTAANTSAIAAQQGASDATSNANLLSQVLAAENQLATAQGTGGASLSYNTNNYLIWGLLGIAGAAIIGLFVYLSKKKS